MFGPKVCYTSDDPGTLRSVCMRYYNEPNHGDCPFARVCYRDNEHPKDTAVVSIINSIDPETLEAMAAAIRRTQTKEAK